MVDRPSHPVGFWVYVGTVTALLAAAWWVITLHTDPGLVRFMAAGALLLVAGYTYAPSCLDLTLWSITVWLMFPAGLLLLIGSPIVYALFVAFIGPHVEVRFK